MRMFNDAQASVSSAGNLSLGFAGNDDAAGNATYGYAKNDVTVFVPPSLIISDTLPVLTYDSVATTTPKRTQVNNTCKWLVPLPLEFIRTTSLPATNPAGAAAAPHGVLVKSLTFYYRVNTSDLTSIAGAIYSTPWVAAGALPTVTAMTTTDAGGTLTAAANVYSLVTTVTTPAFITTANSHIYAIVTVVVPTNTADIWGASWSIGYAMY